MSGVLHSHKMEEEEPLRSFMFLMTYMLLKRRRDLNNANNQRRSEVQRRIRHRQYFFQRQRRMLMVSPILSVLHQLFSIVHDPRTDQSVRYLNTVFVDGKNTHTKSFEFINWVWSWSAVTFGNKDKNINSAAANYYFLIIYFLYKNVRTKYENMPVTISQSPVWCLQISYVLPRTPQKMHF